MYTSFFGLSEKPFAITPDPRYLYLSERHAEALAHLLYGINESGGFIQLTGEVGTGKTTVVRTLLSRIPHHADVAVIMNPRITPAEFLQTICEELGVTLEPDEQGSVKQMVDALNRRLLSAHAQGRRVIVIVDEAQNLSAEVLEQVRLLTNLETPTQKLLQIILIGQPELRELLDRTDLRQLAQRITGRYHLNPLSREETMGYVRHRLRVAGASGDIFTAAALGEVHRLSSGIPRVINVTCDRALLGAYTREQRSVTPALVRRAGGEVYGRRFTPPWLGWAAGGVALAAVAAAGLVVWRTGLWPPLVSALRASLSATPRPASVASAAPPEAAPPTAAAAAPATLAMNPPPVEPAPAAAPTAASTSTSTSTSMSTLAAAPVPAAERAPPVSISSLLEANAASTTDAAAYRRLLALWGTALPNDRDPCAQAAKAGLACLDQRGSWAQVRVLNRPAILTLNDDQGQRHRVVLRNLDDDTATLVLGERDVRVPLQDLSGSWFGEFTVVWKPKTQRPRDLSVGMSGDQVRWLRRSLAALRGAADADRGDDTYDENLAIAVQNFQRAHRLNVDGIAGIQTQVVLDTALAEPGSPLLLSSAPRGG
jgi:general secretion pathway protein A